MTYFHIGGYLDEITVTGYDYKERAESLDAWEPTVYRRPKGRKLWNSVPGKFFQQTKDWYGEWEVVKGPNVKEKNA